MPYRRFVALWPGNDVPASDDAYITEKMEMNDLPGFVSEQVIGAMWGWL